MRRLRLVTALLGILSVAAGLAATPMPAQARAQAVRPAALATPPKTPPGVVVTHLPAVKGGGDYAEGTAVTVDEKDRVLVAGVDGNDVLVLRYRPNGRLDRAFGRKGIARVAVATPRQEAAAGAISVDDRGRILVAATGNAYAVGRSKLVVLRLGQSGRLDRKFGRHGRYTRPRSSASDVVSTASGGIVVTGRSLRPSGALVIGLTSAGRVDRGFGDAKGITRFSVYGSQEGVVVGTSAGSVVVDAEGRYVVEVGVFRGIGQPAENGVARLLPDGRLDSSYYDGGYHTEVTYGPRGSDVMGDGLALRSDGSVVSGGGVAGRFALLGYDADGAPGGLLATTDLAAGQDERSTAVVADAAGGIVSVGYTGRRVGVVRYVDGRADTAFAGKGALVRALRGYQQARAYAVAVDRAGRVVVVGTATPRNYRLGQGILVMRLTESGRLDRHWHG
ncbi:hypothetical protein [Nocardioides sp. YIM 152315]|uniref:hypothetical protein n=1 Tax=Nocardioides sp. YIM 152315 TaxID=3031760 RepID=UPI0023DC9A20|nr:hypothetical protein [Nocardioides sp. YIM 152315]MDF1606399.1 hypothetical protein [Nocardioides sp. YIM 152315]